MTEAYLDDFEPQAEVIKTEVQTTNVEPLTEDFVPDLGRLDKEVDKED